jgi:hypothetical protein
MHIPHQEILEDLLFIERGYLNANHFVYRGDPPTGMYSSQRSSRNDIDLAR